MAERRIDIILRWLEEHPEVVEASKERLEKLHAGFVEASAASKGLTRTAKEQAIAHAAVKEQLAGELEKVVAHEPGYRMLVAAHSKLQAASLETGRRLAEMSVKFRRAGYQVGFFGWIVTFSIRSMMRLGQQLWGMFRKLIMVSVKWPSSLAKVARALGLLQARGLLTAEMEDVLRSAMNKLIEIGPDFEALWAGFEALVISFAVLVTSDLLPILSNLLNWLAVKLADPATREWITNTARMVAEELIPALFDILPALMGVVSAFLPLLPIVASLLRLFGPFIPILFLVGTAFWALGPILTAISGIISIVTGVLGFLAGTFGIVSTAAGGMGIAIGATTIALGPFLLIIGAIIGAIAAIILIWQNWDAIVKAFTPVFEALRPVGEAVMRVLQALWGVIQSVGNIFFQLSRIIVALIGIALKPLMPIFTAIYNALVPIFTFIKNTVIRVLDTFTAGLRALKGMLDAVGGFLGGIADALGALCFSHAAVGVKLFESSLQDTIPLMQESLSTAKRLRRELKEPFAGAVAFGAAPVGARGSAAVEAREVTQYVTVEAPIYIESVSAEVDLDEVEDAVDKGIASGVKRIVT